MESSSCQRVFDVQELLEHLITLLDKADLSRLSRINRAMHTRCSPSLFKVIWQTDAFKIFESIPSTMALGRNTPHVRSLDVGAYEVAYYYNCVRAFQELGAQADGTPPERRPNWLPQPDPITCQHTALPPMNCLSELFVTTSDGFNSHKLPSLTDSRAMLGRISWLITLSSRLTLLYMSSITTKDLRSH